METLKDVCIASPSIDANGKFTFSLAFAQLFEDLPASGVWPAYLEYRSVAFDDKTAGQETLNTQVNTNTFL